MKTFDVVVLGAGPGGYIAAIRASQLGHKVAIVEESKNLGGVCLNMGCIPTKSVLKAAHSIHEIKNFKDMGIDVELKKVDGAQAIKQAKKVSAKLAAGVQFLMKKSNITVIQGRGTIASQNTLEVKLENSQKENVTFKNLIIATGAHYRSFDGLVHDGKRLLGAWEAIKLEQMPKSIGIIGAGAIGVEFAYFYNAFGIEVHLFEMQNRLLPVEDDECSQEVEKAYKKYGIKLSLGVKKVTAKNNGQDVSIFADDKEHKFDMALIAVGMTGNIENIGLEKVGIKTEKGFIKTNEMYQTNVASIYAIGDVSGPPLLAHAASHEGVVAVEHLSGKKPHKIDPKSIPGCTYCQPQVASVGFTERDLKSSGTKYTVGKLPFSANGKAIASFETDGFVKVLMGEHGQMLGAHIVGVHATELIHEYTLFRQMEGIDEEIFATVHPHPTLGEFLAEAVLAAKGRALNF